MIDRLIILPKIVPKRHSK